MNQYDGFGNMGMQKYAGGMGGMSKKKKGGGGGGVVYQEAA